MTKRTAIILVTYNGWSLTENCLRDLSSLPDSDFVIAIADNGSEDCTVEKIRKEFPDVHVYPLKQNLGFGAANNHAIRELASEGFDFDSICLLNNDTRFDATEIIKLKQSFEHIENQVKSLNGREKHVVLAPTVNNVEGNRQNNFFAGLGPDGIGFIQFYLNAFRSESAAARILEGVPQKMQLDYTSSPSSLKMDLEETCWTSAVCWMLSRTLWESTGGFDENIFMYYEDAELALRLRKNGTRFFITPRSIITHLGGGSAKSSLSRALQHDRSQQYVFRKHFGMRGLILSKLFRFSRSLVRILAAIPGSIIGCARQEKREYFRHHFTLLKEALQ